MLQIEHLYLSSASRKIKSDEQKRPDRRN